jgi:hypothetical protein
MNFGMQDIQNVIYRQLVQGNANVTGGQKKFAKDLAKRIYELISKDAPVNIDLRTEFLARGGDMETVKMYDRICKVMAFDMLPLTDTAKEIYKWIADQESSGKKLEVFAAWAREPERAQYFRKYRNDVGNIRNDWMLAFSKSPLQQTEYV